MHTTKISKRSLFTLFVAGLSLLAIASFLGYHYFRTTHTANTPIANLSLSATHSTRLATPVPTQTPTWHSVMVHSGDSLTRIFSRLGIQRKDLYTLLTQYKILNKLRLGETLRFQVDQHHQLLALSYPIDATKIRVLTRTKIGTHFTSTIHQKSLTTTLSFKSVTVHHSLAHTAKQAGLTRSLVHQLDTVFSPYLRFSRDLRSGDHFALLYEEIYADGKKVRNGPILATEFTHRNKTYRLVRYTYSVGHTGYFTPEGRGTEPLFLQKPVNYKRISSYFNRHRLDPILHKVRPHLGIDYAAKNNTPIRSIGNGKIVFLGHYGGYGKTIKIHYGQHYKAIYAHMRYFDKHLRVNQPVKKGQIIGYVGDSGWSTGPHLHFGFFVNGVAENWLAMKFPAGESIPRRYHTRFLATAKQLLAELHFRQATQLAAAHSSLQHD